ncbi:hypothetical protein DENSPDRAFT_836313 [Dentipellis sp. KUC8613]|nr:hypothetical protein DENSPDRAFT_836313 [Dentipellis sp. KUC8613]
MSRRPSPSLFFESPISSLDTTPVTTMVPNDNITPVSLSLPEILESSQRTPAAEHENQSPGVASESNQKYGKHQRFYFDDGNVTFMVSYILVSVDPGTQAFAGQRHTLSCPSILLPARLCAFRRLAR